MWVRPGAYPRVEQLKCPSLMPYTQTLGQAVKAYQGQTLWPITKILITAVKKFYSIGPWSNICELGQSLPESSTSQVLFLGRLLALPENVMPG
jgi:hypothetical protein